MPNKKTQTQLVQEIWQAIYGVPDTSDKGLCGDIKEMTKLQKESNGKRAKLELKFWLLIGFLVGLGIIEGLGVTNLL